MHAMFAIGLVLMFFLAGCDCERCEDRRGIYRVTPTLQSGDCLQLPEQFNIEEPMSLLAPPGCTQGAQNSNDNCVVRIDIDCMLEGQQHIEQWRVEWDCDAHTAKGTIEITGPRNCSSVYDVVYERL